MLNVEVKGSVQVSLEAASIEADGSFKYLTEKMVKNCQGMGYGIWDMGYGIWDMGYGK